VPSDTIVAVAKRSGADLIAMPVRKALSAARIRVPWKTAYHVISHATCPVLTLAE
jgi:nucleotide-binding universal stress UspA family protein